MSEKERRQDRIERDRKASERRLTIARRLREQGLKRKVLEARIAALRAESDAESEELQLIAEEERNRQAALASDRLEMAQLRKGGPSTGRRGARRGSGTGD